MSYRIFGWWYRWQACKMAAQVMQGQGMGTEIDGPTPRIWSLTVFFERYLYGGSSATQDEFGPKEPIQLKDVKVTG